MKTYKKPTAKIIELCTENIMLTGSLGEGRMSDDPLTDTEDIGVNNHRVKLWED